MAESSKFDRFVVGARRALAFSQEEAQRLGHSYIGTEHLLLGLLRERDGVAARVLAEMGVDLDKVREATESIIGRGEREQQASMGLTPRAKKVIELAVDEARRLGHHYIGTEHLLLGIVRESEGVAAGILESLGVDLDRARQGVLDFLAAPPAEHSAHGETPQRKTSPWTSFFQRGPRRGETRAEERVTPEPAGIRAVTPRIGQGFDVHPLVPGRKLILGGVEVPYSRGLEGHSDGDVLLHAIIDALLGALALGDIGQHFPSTDPQFKDIPSGEMLKRVYEIVKEHGWRASNIDATIVAQEPMLASFIPEMRARVADVLELKVEQVSIKAKTTDGLGSIGRGEGIAAQAIALLDKPQ